MLTKRTLKANKARNIVVVIAIALTATLFTSLFAIGSSMISSFQNATMRQVGTSAHGSFKYLSQAQYDNIKESPLLRDISYNIIIGIAENEALLKNPTEIRYSEDKIAEWGFSYPTVGDMPRAGMELACSTITLDLLSIPHELGQKIPLEFTIHGKKYKEEFTLCGFWPGDEAMQATQVFLSREYTDSVVSVPENPSWDDLMIGTINANVWFKDAIDIESKMNAVLEERSYAAGEIMIGVNWAYASGGGIDIATALIVSFLLLLILVSGYLIIYSVFSISVTGDIRFYGLLKTIGTTGKQIRRIVRGQALTLSLFGIPLGFLCGYLLGYALTPALMSATELKSAPVFSVNPLIFLFSGLFSLITVLISCRKPGKIAAKVSPMEAVRYTEAKIMKKRRGKRAHTVSPLSMAWANVRRSPKKLALITLSLSLSLILLNSAYAVVRGFDMDEYLKFYLISDFTVSDRSVYSPFIIEDNFEGVDQSMLSEIMALDGLEETAGIYFYDDDFHKLSPQGYQNLNAMLLGKLKDLAKSQPYLKDTIEMATETGITPMHIYGWGRLAADAIDAISGGFDFEALASGDYVVVTRFDSDDTEPIALYNVGDKVPLVNEAGETREFEVLAVVDQYPYPLSCGHGHITDSNIIMADSVYLDFYGQKQPMMTAFNVADEDIPAAEARLKSYTESTSLDYRSRSFYEAEFKDFQRTYMLTGGALSFVLALIGLLNFINAVFTSIAARRRELAMLQSVGMTGRQLKTMLLCEGIAYAVLTLLFSVTAGSFISRLAVQAFAGEIWFFRWNFTIAPILLAIPALFAVCAVVPLICYRFMKKESVVERLRLE